MNQYLKYFLLIIVVFSISEVFGQNKFAAGSETISAEVYDPVDLVFKLKAKPIESPFDVSFGAVFTSPEKKMLTVPGFYNDNHEFVIRFSASEKGEWSYQTFSSIPQLSGLKGSISVTGNSNPEMHGAVVINPDSPRKFVYEDGKPYFALAFELDWLFSLDYENAEGIPKTTKIIDAVKDNSFRSEERRVGKDCRYRLWPDE